MNHFFAAKWRRRDMPEYRAHVVSIGCIIDNEECDGPVDPNHFTLQSQNGSDSECGGLCRWHHTVGPTSFHRLGFVRFCEHYGIDWAAARARLLESYYEAAGKAFVPQATPDRKKRARGKQLRPLTKTVGKF